MDVLGLILIWLPISRSGPLTAIIVASSVIIVPYTLIIIIPSMMLLTIAVALNLNVVVVGVASAATVVS
jgi:hypothetical protein